MGIYNINLNIHYSAPQEIWDKLVQLYREMPNWNGFVDGCPQWYGTDGKLIEASVEPSGLQFYAELPDVIVVPEYQGKGIGTTMMKRLLAYIDENVPAGGRASVQLIAEKGKEAFYGQLGFKRIPHEYCGSGMRKVIYKE